MRSPQARPSSLLEVDALVIGGGLQGLLILDRLAHQDLSCVLVTSSDLGVGQTLHSHGVLNAGFGMAGPEPVRLLQAVVLPELERRGVETYGEWGAIAPPWPVSSEQLPPPAGLQLHGAPFFGLPEVNVDKRQLLEALALGFEYRIVRGSVSGVRRPAGGDVTAIEVESAGGESLVFAPGVVVVAAGVGSKGLLRKLGADEEQLAPIKHRRVHVLCVRGPSDVLPPLNFVSFRDQLFMAAHPRDGVTTYYATPMEFGSAPVEDVPNDAVAEIDPGFVEKGWEVLFQLCPSLGSQPGLSFSAYAGFRQDIGDMPGMPMCAPLAAVPNVIAALPSGLLGAWPVAAQTSALAGQLTQLRRPQPVMPPSGPPVPVGADYEDTAAIEWSSQGPREPRSATSLTES